MFNISIFEIAKANNLKIHEYLHFLFSNLKDMDSYSNDNLDKIMPWADDLPPNCGVDE